MISIVSNDSGGAEILSSLVKKKPNNYNFILTGPAKKIFKKKIGKFINENNFQILNTSKLVICGTGWQSNLEKKAIKYCLLNNIKVVAYLDHWINYKERFLLNNKYYFPNEIWVGDKYAKKIAKKELKKQNIKLKLNPYFQDLKKIFSSKINRRLISKKKNILYLSEPIKNHVKKNSSKKTYYNEYNCLDFFLKNINKICKKWSLKIRLHPAENTNKYEKFLKTNVNNIKIGNKSSLFEDILNSDLVVGCNTMAMYIAILAKKKVYCSIPIKNIKCDIPSKKIIYLSSI